ncbi:hypothetical protein BGZ88_003978 [Linnemannia elongata]|nr:hypothetical protein BGZ88_003978 [Linnemannia elongata]
MLETFPHMEEYNLSEVEFDPILFKSPGAAGYTKRITTMNLLPCRSDAIHTRKFRLARSFVILSTWFISELPASRYYHIPNYQTFTMQFPTTNVFALIAFLMVATPAIGAQSHSLSPASFPASTKACQSRERQCRR